MITCAVFLLFSVVKCLAAFSVSSQEPLLLQQQQPHCNQTITTEKYSRRLVFTRRLQVLGPQQAYQRTVQGWRRDNFELPLVLPPFVLQAGDETTGVGLVIARVPPALLKEGIIHSYQDDDCERRMYYKVLNPGWFTWPVENHLGQVVYKKCMDGVGCDMEWTIQWTPLEAPAPFDRILDSTLFILTKLIGSAIVEYVALGDPKYK